MSRVEATEVTSGGMPPVWLSGWTLGALNDFQLLSSVVGKEGQGHSLFP